jgi:predicted phosphate transport protein (TIGR00153 family)
VRLRLTPQDTTFFDMLSASADNLVLGVQALAKIFDPAADRKSVGEEVRKIEHEEDEVTHGILRKLNSTFITPFDRDDIYRLAGRLDDVMDFMEAAVDLVVLYKLEELPPEIAEQVDVLQRAALITAEAMPRLRTRKDLDIYWIEVNRLENEADRLYRRLLAKLFDGRYDALTVLKLKEVAEQLEAAADAFENVANAVETIVVKES